MKIKMIVTIMIIAFIVGCNQQQTKPSTTTPPVTTESPTTTPPVTTESPTTTPPTTPDGYLDEETSRQWLKKHDYELVEIVGGYKIEKEIPGRPGTVSITIKQSGKGSNFINKKLPEGVTVKFQNGKIYISK